MRDPASRQGSRDSALCRRLKLRRDSIWQHLGLLGDVGEPESVRGDDVDRVLHQEQTEASVARRVRLYDMLRQITDALERLDAGSYGLCLDCGGPIATTRLQALPEAERCLNCQEEFERDSG